MTGLLYYCMKEVHKGKLSYTQARVIHGEIVDAEDKEDPPIESRGSEQTPLLSKLLLREKCGCS